MKSPFAEPPVKRQKCSAPAWCHDSMTVIIQHLYISPGHNFFGRHGRPAGAHPVIEVPEIDCVAGRGLRGDRFFDYEKNYRGQITFFAAEIYEDIRRALGADRDPSVFRRNVITQGADLNAWIDREFEIQGVRFRGTGECAPCYWMDTAFGPGAKEFLKNRGGLRAMILNDGKLARNA